MNAGKILFIALGAAAACVRVLTLPRRVFRRKFRRAAADSPPVFIYEPYGMGDCIAMQPLVRQWLAAGRRVIVATKPQWAAIFAPHPALTHIGVSPEYASQSETRRKTAFLKDLATIRSAVGNAARGADGIDVRGDVRSILILYTLGCGKVRTLPRYHTANDWPVFPFAARRERLLIGSSRRIVNSAFSPKRETGDFPFPDLRHLLSSEKIRADSRRNPRRIGLIPFASWEGKRWPPENWRELIRILRDEKFDPVILVGPDENATQTIAPPEPPAQVFAANNIADWVTMIDECDAIVTVNTGPMHIADALCKPLVLLEGSSRLPLWGPENPRAVIISHQSHPHVSKCAPCHQTGTTEKCGAKCMTLITPAEVAAACASRFSVY